MFLFISDFFIEFYDFEHVFWSIIKFFKAFKFLFSLINLKKSIGGA